MANKISQGQSAEESEHQAKYPGGWYALDITDEEGNPSKVRILVRDHYLFGTPGADACVRLGYYFEREATPEELTEIDTYAALVAKEVSKVTTKEEFDAMKAQLDQLLAANPT